ncbi:cysteine synthase A [Planctomycetaceae bacterium AH-315-I19]|nr:cysteine synthase A [Planctomycetaceae bacterium AH-315-I19]
MTSQSKPAPALVRKHTYNSLADVVGNTSLVRLGRLSPEGGAEIFLKMESDNPMGSVKDRIGKSMIEEGEANGRIREGTHIIEPTSGNTGISLAFICAAKGYKLTLCMPESMSVERRAVLKQFGANMLLTPAETGMRGALDAAKILYDKECQARGDAGAFMPGQFENPANPAAHEQTTGPEIWADTGGDIDAIVAGVGTGGTITGATRFLRTKNPDFQAFAVEPTDSPVLSGGQPGPHKIQGIGAGFVPDNLDTSLLSGIEQVTNEDAFAWGKKLTHVEGILGGISTGANVCAAVRVASRPEFAGKRIVTICCSFGERYLSTALFQ